MTIRRRSRPSPTSPRFKQLPEREERVENKELKAWEKELEKHAKEHGPERLAELHLAEEEREYPCSYLLRDETTNREVWIEMKNGRRLVSVRFKEHLPNCQAIGLTIGLTCGELSRQSDGSYQFLFSEDEMDIADDIAAFLEKSGREQLPIRVTYY